MAIPWYLAMTPGEVSVCPQLPEHMAWMSCHFSASASGISNIPEELPKGAMLILDDSTPFNAHDPSVVTQELLQVVEQLGIQLVLLDFQRPDVPQVRDLANVLCTALPCSVGVSSPYAQAVNCPIFLPPLPLHLRLEEYLAPYKGRKIWLDLAPGCGELHILPKGNQYLPMPANALAPGSFRDDTLRCRYATSVTEDGVVFSLCRGQEELPLLLEDAEKAGVTLALGLYQELTALF